MKKILQALAVPVLVMLPIVACTLLACRLSGWTWVYGLDDAYIHLAMGRNLALHGVWGIEPTAAAFCSSSPLWTVLMAAWHFVAGAWFDYGPLAFCFVSVFAATVILDRLLARYGLAFWPRLAAGVTLAAAATFPVIVAFGMEHALHAALVTALIACFARADFARRRDLGLLAALAFLSTAVRFESLFLILPLGVCVPFLCARGTSPVRRIAIAAVFVASGVAPVFVYGVAAVAAGGHFLPNSLLMKGSFLSLADYAVKFFRLFIRVPAGCLHLYVAALLVALTAVLRGTPRAWRCACAATFIALGGQLMFSAPGDNTCYRYDAFLMAAAVVCVAGSWAAAGRELALLLLGKPDWLPKVLLAILLGTALVFGRRSRDMVRLAVRTPGDIAAQQVVMARIFAGLPPEQRGPVAIHDLGYMALHAGVPIVDIWSLGTQDCVERLLAQTGPVRVWTKAYMEWAFAQHKVRYAALFKSWVRISLTPDKAIPVANLRLDDRYFADGDEVVFWALSREDAVAFKDYLRRWLAEHPLPPRAHLVIL